MSVRIQLGLADLLRSTRGNGGRQHGLVKHRIGLMGAAIGEQDDVTSPSEGFVVGSKVIATEITKSTADDTNPVYWLPPVLALAPCSWYGIPIVPISFAPLSAVAEASP